MDAVDPTSGAPAPPAADPGSLSATAWRLLTAPTTLLVLGALIGTFLAWSAFIPSDVPARHIAERLGFGTAENTLALGATAPLSSWIFWLLVLLAALNLFGRLLSPRNPHAALATKVSIHVDAPPVAIPGRLAALSPVAAFTRAADAQTVILRRGARVEGAIFIGLGLVALAASFLIDSTRALDARLSVRTGDTSGESMRTRIVIDGLEIDRAMPFRLACNPPDPQDSTRTIGCLFFGPQNVGDANSDGTAADGTEVVLRPGSSTRVSDYVLTLQHARLAAPAPNAQLQVLWRAANQHEPMRLPIVAGQSVRTGDPGASPPPLTIAAGLSGPLPWLAVAEADATPMIYLPGSHATNPASHGFAVIPDETLHIRLMTTPARWLTWIGLFLLAAGLLLWTVVADLTLTAARAPAPAAPETSIVTLSSLNRPAALARWVTALATEPPPSPEPIRPRIAIASAATPTEPTPSLPLPNPASDDKEPSP